MFNKCEVSIFHVETKTQSTGERIVTNADGIVDIDELHSALNDDSKYVIICLHVTNSVVMEEEYYICTSRLKGVNDRYVFTAHTRSTRGAFIRQMIMTFNNEDEEEQITVKYYDE